MSAATSTKQPLQGEINNEVKHQLIESHVYAMAGANKNRERISGNIYHRVKN